MKPAPFVHHAPRTVGEAVAVLEQVGHDGKVLAGGQSLVPILNMRLASPAHLVDINAVAGLDGIAVGDERRAGRRARAPRRRSPAPMRRMPRSPSCGRPPSTSPTLPSATAARPSARSRTPTRPVRCRRCWPSATASVEAVSASGTREIRWQDFFAGPLETTLRPEELAVAVRFAAMPARHPHGLPRVGPPARRLRPRRRRGRGDRGRRRRDPRPRVVRLGDRRAVGARPRRALAASSRGRDRGRRAVDAAAATVREHVQPESDIHATSDYRRMLVGELTRRVLHETALAAEGDRR